MHGTPASVRLAARASVRHSPLRKVADAIVMQLKGDKAVGRQTALNIAELKGPFTSAVSVACILSNFCRAFKSCSLKAPV